MRVDGRERGVGRETERVGAWEVAVGRGEKKESGNTFGSVSKHCHARARYSICLLERGIVACSCGGRRSVSRMRRYVLWAEKSLERQCEEPVDVQVRTCVEAGVRCGIKVARQ